MKKELEEEKVCLLDLPEPVLESILERLSPAELCRLSKVSTCLRRRCSSDYLWKKHMERKWGRLISSDGWQVTDDSIMVYYLSLESGKLWFPAQVFGQHGYALSCYDALVSYNHHGDNFQARYSPEDGRWQTSEVELPWDRLRKPPIIHMSDSTNDLKPGDNIEIRWNDIKEGSYDKLMVEFKQYHIGSIYRRVALNKKGYRETGNAREGYYGDIRRLVDEEEITRWRNLWPSQKDPFQWHY